VRAENALAPSGTSSSSSTKMGRLAQFIHNCLLCTDFLANVDRRARTDPKAIFTTSKPDDAGRRSPAALSRKIFLSAPCWRKSLRGIQAIGYDIYQGSPAIRIGKKQ